MTLTKTLLLLKAPDAEGYDFVAEEIHQPLEHPPSKVRSTMDMPHLANEDED